MDPCVERGGDTAFGNAVRAGRSFPSEFTFEIAIIFSSLLDPVSRACLAQLRAPSRVRLVGGARCGARVPVLTQTGLRVVSDHRPRRRKTGLPSVAGRGRTEG